MRGYPLLKSTHPFGHEFSGVIAAVGEGVMRFAEGDRVAVHNSAPCGSCHWCKHGQFFMCDDLLFNRGSYAEYVRVPARIVLQSMFKLPDSMSHKTASLMESFACAVCGIVNCPIEPGDFVVIDGAGPIDTWQTSCHMARKGGFVWLFGGTKAGSMFSVDATRLHYSQLTVKGVFHTTPLAVKQAFKLLELGVIDERDFIQNEYRLADLEAALLEHASGEVIKNCIVYE